ncbi:hypothetical protein [Nocardia amamiensis]|uniref:hypothetical protein n=1 Tax=Nocardia amamiensis TaxID=404578 RepID=UPI003F7EA949
MPFDVINYYGSCWAARVYNFADYMTLADIYAYPGRHYDHHRRQLTLTGMR